MKALLAAASLSLVWIPSGAPSSAQALSACRLVPLAAVQAALGSVDPTKISSEAIGSACSWHSTEPHCFLRSVSVTVVSADDASQRFEQAAADTGRIRDVGDDDMPTVGDASFYSTDTSVANAAIALQYLDVLAGDSWYRLSLLGRFDPDSGRALLGVLAAEIPT